MTHNTRLPARPGTGTKRHLQATTRTSDAPRGISNASSVAQGDGHGTLAMCYAARHTSLSRVEESSPAATACAIWRTTAQIFGAAPASLKDIAGIEQRLAIGDRADRDKV